MRGAGGGLEEDVMLRVGFGDDVSSVDAVELCQL